MLDASTILAPLFGEPGAVEVAEVIATGGAVISTVSLSEVAAVFVRRDKSLRPVLPAPAAQVIVESFGPADGYATAEMCR